MSQAWVLLGSALLGAVVGGMASFAASLLVDRYRLRRETRARIYDELMEDAIEEVTRRVRLAEKGGTDANALAILPRLRRAVVVAGKKDIKQISGWQHAYSGLLELEQRVAALRSEGTNPDEVPLHEEVKGHGNQVLEGLEEYSTWLERRLAAPLSGTPQTSERSS